MSGAVPEELSLERFGQLHPWPAGQRALGRPLEWLWHFELPVAPDEAWRSLGDTERTNRATGLTTLRYEEVRGELIGSHMTAGVRHEFVERWEWVTGSTIELVREYRTGLARLMRNIYRFDPGPGSSPGSPGMPGNQAVRRPLAGGTRLSIYYGWIPRGRLGPLAIRIGMHFYARRFRALVQRVRAEMARGPAVADHVAVMRAPPATLDSDRRLRIARLREGLEARGVDRGALDRLIALAASGDDLELDRIRVRQLAREWGLDERKLIRTALHATRAGLLQLTWDVMCPHCRGVRQKLSSLGAVPERGDCDACAVQFGTAGEQAIEVTFRVHPSIREVPELVYCSAQAVRRSHVRLQQRLARGTSRDIAAPLVPGRYRLRRHGEEEFASIEVVARLPAGQRVEWGPGAAPSRAQVGPDPVFVLRAADRDETFFVEEEAWDGEALRPVHIFNMQDFRDLFSEESLAAGVQLFVGEQTILFSDIVGSTRLYAESGDPAAFTQVKRHFAEIYEQVAAHGGVVVKTIGDAVMAAFSDPVNAIGAARDIHQRFPGAANGARTSVRLRISIHTGPCIAVNLNSGIDYFGGTVNTAAKLQRCAGAGEAALSEAVQRAPGVAEALRLHGGPLRSEVLEHDALGRLRVAVWAPATGRRAAGAA